GFSPCGYNLARAPRPRPGWRYHTTSVAIPSFHGPQRPTAKRRGGVGEDTPPVGNPPLHVPRRGRILYFVPPVFLCTLTCLGNFLFTRRLLFLLVFFPTEFG